MSDREGSAESQTRDALAPSGHLLFVEDDPDIRGLVADFLGAHGFRVSVAENGDEMDVVLSKDAVDLLLLDIMLPKEDGLSLCRRVRASGDLPVIMVTARGGELDRVIGLELGADDYLTKPFSTHELLARIRAVLRRSRAFRSASAIGRSSTLTFAGWRLDLAARRLHSADGTRIPLTGGEFELLAAFCEHPNRILTREQLLEFTHARTSAAFERSIDIQVSRLRRKIEPNAQDPVLIQTVRSGGYLFTPDVRPQ